MYKKLVTLFFFYLLTFNLQSQNKLAILNNCKKIDSKEFIRLRKANPNIKISSIFGNGKTFTKKSADSIRMISKKNNIRQSIYKDTVKNSLILFHKILSPLEIEQQEKAIKEKFKKDKIYRKKINKTQIDELNLVDLNNNKHTLESLKGKVIVLNFWFTQCKPCVAEFPDLNKLKAEFKGKPVEFFAVTFNSKNSLNKFFENHELDYITIPNGGAIIDKFKIQTYPSNIIIDKNGKFEYINNVMVLNIFNKMKRKIKNLL